MALTGILLMVSTWRLWWPQAATAFPIIPWFEGLCDAPRWIDRGLTVACLLGLGGVCFTSLATAAPWVYRSRAAALLWVIASGVALIALNQHRLQPWFYQLMIFSTLWCLEPRDASRTVGIISPSLRFWLRAIVISVYFHSAIGKFDFQFLNTVGQQFLTAVLAFAGVAAADLDGSLRLGLVFLIPTVELLLAVGLAGCWWSGSRGLVGCAWLAAVFHLGLMVTLGLGLGHSAGVVLWNLQFAGLALMLFHPRFAASPPAAALAQGKLPPLGHATARYMPRLRAASMGVVSMAVMGLPLVERWGYWDHWPSWALYAPHSSRVEVLVAPQAVAKLPSSLQRLIEERHANDIAKDQFNDEINWVRVPLSDWSLDTLSTPIYPQARFQLGVAQQLADELRSPFLIQAMVLSSANRWSGERQEKILRGSAEIAAKPKDFWWNTRRRR